MGHFDDDFEYIEPTIDEQRELYHKLIAWADQKGGLFKLLQYQGVDANFYKVEKFGELKEACDTLKEAIEDFTKLNDEKLGEGGNCECNFCKSFYGNFNEYY